MRKLDHCNIVRLRYFFYSSGEKVRPQCVEESSTLTPPVCLPAFLMTTGLFPRYSPQTFPPPVPCSFLTMPHTSPLLSAERRALSKSGAGICARDGVPGGPPFYQGQVDHPYHLCQGRQAGRLLGPRPTKPGAPDRHSCLCGFPHLQVYVGLWRPHVPCPCPYTPRDGARQRQGSPTQGLTQSGRQADQAGEAAWVHTGSPLVPVSVGGVSSESRWELECRGETMSSESWPLEPWQRGDGKEAGLWKG